MKKYILVISFFLFVLISELFASSNTDKFKNWLDGYKKYALKKGISNKTLEIAFAKVQYLPKVIEYDRKQPEFFEDTITYISKRATKKRSRKAQVLFEKNSELFNEIQNKYKVEKEILLALWGIETNFGQYVGKMDIISSLATLSFDLRRRDFFSAELLVLLKLIDVGLIDINTLYGSWAGAYGNFQFMPSSILNYAIDYDKNGKIELKTSTKDALASAANYISKMGWRKDTPCFYRVKSNKIIEKKLINLSAQDISNRLKLKYWREKGILMHNGNELVIDNYKAALILPDGDKDSPMYLVFHNYEKILKWNRSLRFAISVCTLSDLIKNEI